MYPYKYPSVDGQRGDKWEQGAIYAYDIAKYVITGGAVGAKALLGSYSVLIDKTTDATNVVVFNVTDTSSMTRNPLNPEQTGLPRYTRDNSPLTLGGAYYEFFYFTAPSRKVKGAL